MYQLLKPLVAAPSNRIYLCTETLKLRETFELESKPAQTELLPAGTMVLVVERRTLPNGVERAAVARVGVHEGVCGWITAARDETETHPRVRPVTATRRTSLKEQQRKLAEASAPEGAPSAADGVHAPSSAPDAAATGKGGSRASAPGEAGPKGGKKKKGDGADSRPALTSSNQLETLAATLLKQAAAEESKLDDSKKPLSVKLGEVRAITRHRVCHCSCLALYLTHTQTTQCTNA